MQFRIRGLDTPDLETHARGFGSHFLFTSLRKQCLAMVTKHQPSGAHAKQAVLLGWPHKTSRHSVSIPELLEKMLLCSMLLICC